MFTRQNSKVILGEMQKFTDETLENSRVCKSGNKKIEVPTGNVKLNRKKLFLKYTRCPILD